MKLNTALAILMTAKMSLAFPLRLLRVDPENKAPMTRRQALDFGAARMEDVQRATQELVGSIDLDLSLSLDNGMSMPSNGLSLSLSMNLQVEDRPLADTDGMMSMTNPPTPAPTVGVAEFSGCMTAFAYCEGLSTCFIDNLIPSNGMSSGAGPWGWNIDLQSVDLSNGKELVCQLWAGAGRCNFSNGYKVGKFIITENSVEYNMDPPYGSSTLHFYAGKCKGSDNAEHLQDGMCDDADVAMWARVPGKYPLVTGTFSTFINDFTFFAGNEASYTHQPWSNFNYQVFPIGGLPDRRYLTAHADVCACPASGCAATANIDVDANDVSATTRDTNAAAGIANNPAQTAGLVVVATVAVLGAAFVIWRRRAMGRHSSNASVVSDCSASIARVA